MALAHPCKHVNVSTQDQQRTLCGTCILATSTENLCQICMSALMVCLLLSVPCARTNKPHKTNHRETNTGEATDCWQDIQVDLGFFVKHSSKQQEETKVKAKSLKGIKLIATSAIIAQRTHTHLCKRMKLILRRLQFVCAIQTGISP